MRGTPFHRLRRAAWILVVLPLLAEIGHAKEGGAELAELRALETYVETQQFRSALETCEAQLETEKDSLDLHALAARCAMRAGLYDRSIQHARNGRKAIQRLEERTDASRALSKELKELEGEVGRLRTVRDKHIPKIVQHLILYLPWWSGWNSVDRSRYLQKATWDLAEGWYDRALKEEYESPHLTLVFRGAPRIHPILVMVESYPDEETARKRYAQLKKHVVRQRGKWGKHYAERRKVRGHKLEQRTEEKDPHADERRWVLATTSFVWIDKEGLRASEGEQAEVSLVNFLVEGEATPRPEAWFHVITCLDANEMRWVRD